MQRDYSDFESVDTRDYARESDDEANARTRMLGNVVAYLLAIALGLAIGFAVATDNAAMLAQAIRAIEFQRSQIFDDAPELDKWLRDARATLQRAQVNSGGA
jgi:hypothetical protein